MATSFISPGVYVVEKDNSEYAPSLNSSVVGVVGFASKGPVAKATLITSPNQLIDTFGQPSEDLPGQGIYGTLEMLETTDQIYFCRSTITSALNASAIVSLGGCPAVEVAASAFGSTSNIYFKVQVWDNNGNAQFILPKQIAVPSGTVSSTGLQAQALQKVFGGSLDSDKVGVFYDSTNSTKGWIVGLFAGSGASLGVSAYSDSNYTNLFPSAVFPVDILGNTSSVAGSSLRIYGTTLSSTNTVGSSVGYLVQSLYPGAGYNAGTKPDGSTSGNSFEIRPLGWQNVLAQVNDNGVASEEFKISLVNSGVWLEDQINVGLDNNKSNVIKAYLVSGGQDFTPTKLDSFTQKLTSLGVTNIGGTQGPTATLAVATPRFVKPIQGTYSLAAGTNGTAGTSDDIATALIGDNTVTPKTGMQLLDDPSLNVSIAIVPGITDQRVQNALITLAEDTQDFIAVVSPPLAIGTPQNAIDWHNGLTIERSTPINSSFATIFWPWVQVFSVFDSKDKWYDPGIFGVRQMTYTDNVAEAWIAPAGFVRGRLTKPTAVEVKLNLGDRNSLYSGGNTINPVVSFPQQGITIFGQRTTKRTPSALDRINIRRLMIYLRKVILAATQTIVFEPNDVFTWEKVKGIIDPMLDDIKLRRGLTEFRVVCDETTNTPQRIDRNELWCKVLLKPTKTAEIIIFELNVTNSSAKLG